MAKPGVVQEVRYRWALLRNAWWLVRDAFSPRWQWRNATRVGPVLGDHPPYFGSDEA